MSIMSGVVRGIALAALLFISIAVAATVSGVAQSAPAESAATAPSGSGAAAGILVFCILVTGVFSWTILRSCWRGTRLVVAVCLAYFGLGTLLPQIESVVFLPRHLPPGFVGRLFAMGAIVACLFAPLSVLVLGRFRRAKAPAVGWAPAAMTKTAWAWKIGVLAVVYVAVYFLAGYFIAFRDPQLLAYYDTTDPGSFLAQIQRVWGWAPWMFALQALRGALWVACVVPVVLSFRGRRLELPFLVGCLFAVWSAMLLTPNPFMPDSVRLTHLEETLPSNFLFGWLVGALLGGGFSFRAAPAVPRRV
jgi:hypothetical protein